MPKYGLFLGLSIFQRQNPSLDMFNIWMYQDPKQIKEIWLGMGSEAIQIQIWTNCNKYKIFTTSYQIPVLLTPHPRLHPGEWGRKRKWKRKRKRKREREREASESGGDGRAGQSRRPAGRQQHSAQRTSSQKAGGAGWLWATTTKIKNWPVNENKSGLRLALRLNAEQSQKGFCRLMSSVLLQRRIVRSCIPLFARWGLSSYSRVKSYVTVCIANHKTEKRGMWASVWVWRLSAQILLLRRWVASWRHWPALRALCSLSLFLSYWIWFC